MISLIVSLVWMVSLAMVFAYGTTVGEGRHLERRRKELTEKLKREL